jgi:hypothetical protein
LPDAISVSIYASGTVSETVADFGVYKRPGFDRALEAVRALPGMAGLTPLDAARRGVQQAGARHPRDRYNPRLVDVVPKEEARGREGLIATHRGTRTTATPDGRWARLRIKVAERDARTVTNRVASALMALMHIVSVACPRDGPVVPRPCEVEWIEVGVDER